MIGFQGIHIPIKSNFVGKINHVAILPNVHAHRFFHFSIQPLNILREFLEHIRVGNRELGIKESRGETIILVFWVSGFASAKAQV